MKNKNITKGLLVVISSLFFAFFIFVRGDVFALWENCCYDGSGAHNGRWNAEGTCCRTGTPSVCCTTEGNCTLIPCPTCNVCGNNTVNTGEDCDPPGSTCSNGQTCSSTCQCPDVPCNRCTLPNCPNPPLSNTASDYKLSNFVSCSDSGNCSSPTTHYRDCYEVPSAKPTISLVINPETVPTTKGFVSDTYSGAGIYVSPTQDDSVNDPINMVATYRDSTSAEIETLYIWFKKENTAPITPQYIDLNNSSTTQQRKTHSNSQFGFLMHKEGGAWVPYIPGIAGAGNTSGDRWLPTSYSNSEFYIFGPGSTGQNQLVKVKINSITSSGNSVILNFSLTFNNLTSKVEDGRYYIFMMGNDIFGFTPYNNYEPYTDGKTYSAVAAVIHNLWGPEQIRYYDQWLNSSKVWNVDLTKPVVSSVQAEVVGKTTVRYTWNIAENIALNNVVANLYFMTGFKNLKEVRVLGFTGGGTITPTLAFYYLPPETGTGIIGHLVSGYLVKITGDNRTGSLTVDMGDNGQGVLDFHVTAFDRGGNVGHNQELFDLRDWMITQGGLLYSQGIDVSIKEFASEPGTWSAKNLLKRVNYQYSDISTELVGIKTIGNPSAPTKSSTTASYMVRPYVILDYPSYYTVLKGLFEKRSESLPIQQLGNISTLNSLPPSPSSNTIFVGNTVGNLTVSSNFVCSAQGVFFVSQDLNIEGRIRNSVKDKDACIFIVGRNVNIGQGIHVSSDAVMQYDEVNAYILGDGTVTINKESGFLTYDGLYINGGIHSLTGVIMERTLKLQDRLYYPSFVVDHHSKYGKLARRLFGSQVNFQKIELGLKPY